MLEFATNQELDEIKQDLLNNSEKFKTKANRSKVNKKKKIEIQHFTYEDVIIYIGKNNIQNDYLSNKLARNNDYWFHVKDSSGAHIVVSVPNNYDSYEMSENIIRLASNLAAYFSKYSKVSSFNLEPAVLINFALSKTILFCFTVSKKEGVDTNMLFLILN